MNAANEQAVALFLEEQIAFVDIPKFIERVCDRHRVDLKADPALSDVLATDAWARQAVREAAAGSAPERWPRWLVGSSDGDCPPPAALRHPQPQPLRSPEDPAVGLASWERLKALVRSWTSRSQAVRAASFCAIRPTAFASVPAAPSC
jgi:hypothetical protein